MTITLEATKREGTPAQIREAEMIPAVYYSGGKDAVSVTVSQKELIKVWKEAGETTAVMLTIGGEKIPTLIHDIQRDPVSGMPMHVDFLKIDMNKEIEVPVPLEFVGLAEAEKGGIGTLVKVLHEVHVMALPSNLPHSIEVDVTHLATLDDQIHVKDIPLPTGVTLITDGEEVVALMTAFAAEETEEVAAADLSSIEVEKKGKKEDQEEAA